MDCEAPGAADSFTMSPVLWLWWPRSRGKLLQIMIVRGSVVRMRAPVDGCTCTAMRMCGGGHTCG